MVGNSILAGTSITSFKVISCKISCRERWTQDNWSFDYPPQVFLLVTLSSDYPCSKRFQESSIRKIITTTPKKNDDRIYPFDFEDLLTELLPYVL